MESYILLDRSGSMATNWVETMGALNAFAEDLAKEKPKTRVTLACFDAAHEGLDFAVLRDRQRAGDWSPLDAKELTPRGTTPLLDALGKLSTRIDEAKPKKATVTIITDGHENASKEITKAAARAIIERWKAAGYDVVFIGASFDAFGEAGNLGVGMGQTLNAAKGNYEAAMKGLATRSVAYAATGDNTAAWSDEDRRKAAGEDPQGTLPV